METELVTQLSLRHAAFTLRQLAREATMLAERAESTAQLTEQQIYDLESESTIE